MSATECGCRVRAVSVMAEGMDWLADRAESLGEFNFWLEVYERLFWKHVTLPRVWGDA